MDETRFNELQARLRAAVKREQLRNNPPKRSHIEDPDDDGMWFSRRDEAIEQAAGEHWGRRRRAEQELASRQRLYDAQRRDLNAGLWGDGDDAA